jgi:hypothetical protein
MSWREFLGVPEPDSASSNPVTSVTSVTAFAESENTETASAVSRLDRPALIQARAILNRAGVRKFDLNGDLVIGLWSDQDGPELRAALHILELEDVPVRYLDSSCVPTGYKLRQVEGEPVSLDVLKKMEQSAEPWRVRDTSRRERRISLSEWHKEAINIIFTAERHRRTQKSPQ